MLDSQTKIRNNTPVTWILWAYILILPEGVMFKLNLFKKNMINILKVPFNILNVFGMLFNF